MVSPKGIQNNSLGKSLCLKNTNSQKMFCDKIFAFCTKDIAFYNGGEKCDLSEKIKLKKNKTKQEIRTKESRAANTEFQNRQSQYHLAKTETKKDESQRSVFWLYFLVYIEYTQITHNSVIFQMSYSRSTHTHTQSERGCYTGNSI